MRLTERSKYALLVMFDILNNSKGTPVRAIDVAERQGIDHEYLYKVLRRLRVHQLIRSEKGRSGGYILSRSADEISLFEIFKAAETKISYADFMTKPTKTSTNEYISLFDTLEELCSNIVEDYLTSISLKDANEMSIPD